MNKRDGSEGGRVVKRGTKGEVDGLGNMQMQGSKLGMTTAPLRRLHEFFLGA